MSQTGCYLLHMYCDAPDHEKRVRGNAYNPPDDEFTGVGAGVCWQQARRAGWRRYKGKDYCPICIAKVKGE